MNQYFYTDPKTGTKTEVSLAEAQRLWDAGERENLTLKEVADTATAPEKDIDYSISTAESRENKLGALQQRGPSTRAEELSKVIDTPESAEVFATIQPYSAAYYAANPQELDKPWYRTSAGQIQAGAQDALSLPGRLLSAGVNTGVEGVKGLFSDQGYAPDESFTSGLGRIHEDRGTNFAGSVVRDPLTASLMLTGAGATAAGVPALLSGLYGTVGRYAPALAGALGLGAASAAEGALVGGEDESIIADAVAGMVGSLGGSVLNAASRSQIVKNLAARFKVPLVTAQEWLNKYGGYKPSDTARALQTAYADATAVVGGAPRSTGLVVAGQPGVKINGRSYKLSTQGRMSADNVVDALAVAAHSARTTRELSPAVIEALEVVKTDLADVAMANGGIVPLPALKKILEKVSGILPGTDEIYEKALMEGASNIAHIPQSRATLAKVKELIGPKGKLKMNLTAEQATALAKGRRDLADWSKKLSRKAAAAEEQGVALKGAYGTLKNTPPFMLTPEAAEAGAVGFKHWIPNLAIPPLNRLTGGLENTIAPWAYPGIPLASDRYQAGMGRRGELADLYGMD